jgi:hypothetical protein
MKTIVTMRIAAHRLPGGAEQLLAQTNCSTDVAIVERSELFGVREEIVRVRLDHTDPRLKLLDAVLADAGVKPLISRVDEFSDEELHRAPLLRMVGDANIWAYAGPSEGMTYDMTAACSTCATGLRQTSPLNISADHLSRLRKYRAIGTWGHGPLVDGGLVKKLRNQGVTGISFGDVYAHRAGKERELVARDQLLPTHTLPPLSPDCVLDRSQLCPSCHRGGWNGISGQPFRLLYRRQDLGDIRDVNVSWEWFGPFEYDGNIERARFSTPELLVTPKVMNIFREAGVKTFDWIPIFVEE